MYMTIVTMRVLSLLFLLTSLAGAVSAISPLQRLKVIDPFSVRRNASSDSTPLQVGNGNFAFGADITGLQTFKPFGILSTWGWHNFSLPTTPNQTSIDDFTGMQWWTHDRLVTYNQPNPAQNDISNWLRENPHRLNLGNIGFTFDNPNVTERDLQNKSQVLYISTGKLLSSFAYNGSKVQVETRVDPDSDTVGIFAESDLLRSSRVGLFLDFPYPDHEKFNAPFVGLWNETASHTTSLEQTSPNSATIRHQLGDTVYFVSLNWEYNGTISGPAPGTHRYFFTPKSGRIRLTAAFTPDAPRKNQPAFTTLAGASNNWWSKFWNSGAFVDLTAVKSPQATELQRRIILSQYLLAVNSAGSDPPQESGLVNNGWYGKFHLEMTLWHTLPFARWNQFPLLWRSLPSMYTRFLPSSLSRAQSMGYSGARWGKMTDPSGRSAPGEINSLLIWQQPHPMYFAETEYRSFPNLTTLHRWDAILTATADYMASFAYYNTSTGVYDLGPPMYPVSENTNPNATRNPTFELAYWRFGLDVAIRWKTRLNQSAVIPESWTTVRDNLAPLPLTPDSDGATYPVYEGIPNMWTDPSTTNDHPAMAGIFGLLPPPPPPAKLDMSAVRRTAERIRETWSLDSSLYGWDFAMLAMNELRLGNVQQAVEYLLHPAFGFDDAGYPVGGERVPTPYFPNSAGLLVAVAMMAGGWDGGEGRHFPGGWEGVEVEGFVAAL